MSIPETYLEKKRKQWISENPDPFEVLFEDDEFKTVRNLRTGMIIQCPKKGVWQVVDFTKTL